METNFTISEGTTKLLTIYKELDKLASNLYDYCLEELPNDEEVAESKFHKLFNDHVIKIQNNILLEIDLLYNKLFKL